MEILLALRSLRLRGEFFSAPAPIQAIRPGELLLLSQKREASPNASLPGRSRQPFEPSRTTNGIDVDGSCVPPQGEGGVIDGIDGDVAILRGDGVS